MVSAYYQMKIFRLALSLGMDIVQHRRNVYGIKNCKAYYKALKRLLNSYNKIVGQDNAVSFDEIKLRFIILAGCRPTGTSHSKVSSITGN